MNPTPSDVDRSWEELKAAFRGPTGVNGERIFRLSQAEQECAEAGIHRFKNYAFLADAFFDFAVQSTDIVSVPMRVYHVLRIPLFVSSVSRLRSSYVVFWKGYFFDAASLLRGCFENSVHLCADAHGWSSIGSWFDFGDLDLKKPRREVDREVRKQRQGRDRAVEAKVFRAESGLSTADQDELATMVSLMHSHVHKTEMHLVHLSLEAQQNNQVASLCPNWNDLQASHYPNVFLAIAWMFVRLLSHAVPEQRRSATWTTARDALEKSLRYHFQTWDKPLAGAIARLVDANFAFTGEWAEPPPSKT